MIAGELERLQELKRLDLALDEIARKETAAKTRLAESVAHLEAAREAQKSGKKLLDDALKEHKTHDLDLKKSEEQVKKHSTQMYEVKTNKEFTALKDEIDKGKAENQKIEDKILALMLREDELKGAMARGATELAATEQAHRALDAEVKAELASLEQARGSTLEERKGKAASMPAALLHRYERIRALRGGSVLARVVEAPGGGETACGECHMTIRPQIIVELHRAHELIACESCGRILFLETTSANAT